MRTIGLMVVAVLLGVTSAVAPPVYAEPLHAKEGYKTDYADGFSGGPDYWDIANLSSGETLNVRSEPGASKQIIGALMIGDRVRNLGCKPTGSSRWCKIETGHKQKFTGWVNGKYLREAAGSPQVMPLIMPDQAFRGAAPSGATAPAITLAAPTCDLYQRCQECFAVFHIETTDLKYSV
jgi:uncharacterized protein YgiM (DUF1202 family)